MVDAIRNFSIIAHIDHGKSTLADRFIEKTGLLLPGQVKAQHLDSMDLERERGITIKAKTVRMAWKDHVLNLIDTPGHVDFAFEVHRALWASEGVLLVIDATQGIQAQTVANCLIARKSGLAILPVINKIDLPSARPEETALEAMEILDLNVEPFLVSAKLGTGIEALLDGIVSLIPPPASTKTTGGAALIFDSVFDAYKGVMLYLRVFEGQIRAGDNVRFFHEQQGKTYTVEDLGYLTPAKRTSVEVLHTGEVGYVFCGIKDPRQVTHGETLLTRENIRDTPVKPMAVSIKPFIFVGIYPVQIGEVEGLGKAFEKLHLTDPSFEFAPEYSVALGPGFRCGFLGLLHLEIIQQRLKREFEQNIIITNPSVNYRVNTKDHKTIEVNSPAKFPPHGDINSVEEPYVTVKILTPF
ncbi:MAG: GTP-binding protein, partial [Elusimicrobiota bacterium]